MIKTVYAGYISVHPNDFTYHRDSSDDNWLIVNTINPAEFYIDGQWKTYSDNRVIIFPPHTQADYKACNGINYINHWVSFITNETYITNTRLPFATPLKVSNQDTLDYLFHMIAAENFFNYEFKAQSINHLFHLLFDKLMEGCAGQSTSMLESLSKLRFEIHGNPGFPWTVPYIADQLNVSTGYLQTLYKSTFGMSCMEDVFQKRIALAKDYLAHSSYNVSQISEFCGYQNIEHFCRQFKRITSMTASEYRRQNNII